MANEPTEQFVEPTLDRALRDLRFYGDVLTRDKPNRYEVYQTAAGGTVRLSDCIKMLLDEYHELRAKLSMLRSAE